MTHEMETAVSRLRTLPETVQSEVAPRLNAYLNKLDDLRVALQEGRESGDDGPLDMSEIIREAQAENGAKPRS